MDKKQARTALLSAALALLAVCVLLAGATYAWFTFDTYTKVVPMEARISDGDMNLLISESRKGPFDVSCPLNPENYAKVLYPVSTADLDVFHLDKNQNGEIVTDYRLATQEDLNHSVIYGTVYLKSEGHSCDIFLKAPPLNLGSDPQWLAAGRLGLQITGRDGKKLKFILRLDGLGQTGTALLCVIIARTWQMLPWYMAFLLGGLQSVSLDQVEAAHIDGASNWTAFWHVILPGMKQTAVLVFILGLIGNLQHFDLPWTMTQGGPARATTTLSIEVYATAFKNWNMGKAATVGTIWAILLAIFSIIYLRQQNKEES